MGKGKKSRTAEVSESVLGTALIWLSTSRSASDSQRLLGRLFQSSERPAGSPDVEPSTGVMVQCSSGGHGRCRDIACRCGCHLS